MLRVSTGLFNRAKVKFISKEAPFQEERCAFQAHIDHSLIKKPFWKKTFDLLNHQLDTYYFKPRFICVRQKLGLLDLRISRIIFSKRKMTFFFRIMGSRKALPSPWKKSAFLPIGPPSKNSYLYFELKIMRVGQKLSC